MPFFNLKDTPVRRTPTEGATARNPSSRSRRGKQIMSGRHGRDIDDARDGKTGPRVASHIGRRRNVSAGSPALPGGQGQDYVIPHPNDSRAGHKATIPGPTRPLGPAEGRAHRQAAHHLLATAHGHLYAAP